MFLKWFPLRYRLLLECIWNRQHFINGTQSTEKWHLKDPTAALISAFLDNPSTLLSTVFTGTKKCSNENCWQWDLWIIQKNGSLILERHSAVDFVNLIFQCFELHKQNSVFFHCLAVEAVLEVNHITMAWLWANWPKPKGSHGMIL